jgi:hypothetical protein
MFPNFLLKRLYLKSSLKPTKNGFSFIIKNGITNGTVAEVDYLKYNDLEIPPDQISVETEDGKIISASSINPDNPFLLKKGVNTIFSIVHPPALDQIGSKVKIGLKFKIKEVGKIKFDFSDELINREE